MDSTRSRTGILMSLGAAAGAFVVAAMMSAATAPIARADAYTDIINAIDGDFTAGQAAFTTAFTDFGGSDVNDGLAALFSGLDDDLVGAPDSLYVGTVDALTDTPVIGTFTFDLLPVTSLTTAFTDVSGDLAIAQADDSVFLQALEVSNFAYAADISAIASEETAVFPWEQLVQGALGSLGF
jgi:hypothetical protein